MEKILQQTLLFDFYGELLTEHQQRIYQDVICNDLSCSEVAKEQGVSRQGVHDLIRRCTRQLEEYESRLHLVERFLKIRQDVNELHMDLKQAQDTKGNLNLAQMICITERILEEL